MGSAIAGLVIAGASLIVLPSTGVGAVGPCSPTATRTLAGVQTSAFTSTLAANERVDASTATWTGTTPYPVYFNSGGDSCWIGGSIKGTFPVTTTWNVYHGNAGMGVADARVTIDHPRIFNYGDGIRIRDNGDDFLVKDAYLGVHPRRLHRE